MGIIIWLGIWVYILFPGSQQIAKEPVSPTVSVPTENYPKENLLKPHKSKQKIVQSKNSIHDSAAQAKQMRIDSLYKILMNNYEQKRASNKRPRPTINHLKPNVRNGLGASGRTRD